MTALYRKKVADSFLSKRRPKFGSGLLNRGLKSLPQSALLRGVACSCRITVAFYQTSLPSTNASCVLASSIFGNLVGLQSHTSCYGTQKMPSGALRYGYGGKGSSAAVAAEKTMYARD